MNARRLLVCLLVALVPLTATAQLDDLLTPLSPSEGKEPKKKKKAVTRKKRPPKSAKKAEPVEEPDADPVVVPLVAEKGSVLVRVSGPSDGAQVTLDGRELRPGQKTDVDAGEHTIVVRRPGWSDFSRKVRVTAGQALEVVASLDAVAGVLSVTADVPGSVVLLDGRSLGPAPINGQLVEPGSHTVTVRREGFEESVSSLFVRAGRDYTVRGNLKPLERTRSLAAVDADRPEATRLVPNAPGDDQSLGLGGEQSASVGPVAWYQRWYVWAGAGAVVAAAVTSAVVVSNNAASAALSPDEVCGGTCDDVINRPAGAFRF